MQYTKDRVLKLAYNFKYRNKYKYVQNVENLYLKLVTIVGVSVLIMDFCIVKQFVNILSKI